MVGDNLVSTENVISTGVLVTTRSLEFGAITLWDDIICRAGIMISTGQLAFCGLNN